MEHSENKIITQSGLFQNMVLQLSVPQTRALQKYQRHKPYAIDCVSFLSSLYLLLADFMFVERRAGAFQVQPCFRNT